MPNLVIIRGLPGSGKSTTAKKCFPRLMHYEADQFHMKNGIYMFDPANLKRAHEYCYLKTLSSLKLGYGVVVSNTFTTVKEMQRYYNLRTKIQDLKITIWECTGQFGSIHNVPESKMAIMKKRWQLVPTTWSVNLIECNH